MNEYVLEKTNRTRNKIAQLKKEKKIEIKVKTVVNQRNLERDKEETKREFRENSDDLYFMLIKPIYRLIVRRPKAFT